MKFLNYTLLAIATLACLPERIASTAELKSIGGITAFGGAERDGQGAGSTGIGGLDLLGLVPVGSNLGLQGGLTFSGGQGFRLALNAGPVLNFTSADKTDLGKIGLFVDYDYRAREAFNYVAIRGIGGYYFDRFDILGSYSQPVSSVKHSDGTTLVGINELRGIVRYYPTNEIELNTGILVNSFAGPNHNDNGGTGVGGSFGASFKLFDPLVIRLVDGKIDNRERFRITSGIELIFGSSLKDWTRAHISTPGVASEQANIKSTRKAVAPRCVTDILAGVVTCFGRGG